MCRSPKTAGPDSPIDVAPENCVTDPDVEFSTRTRSNGKNRCFPTVLDSSAGEHSQGFAGVCVPARSAGKCVSQSHEIRSLALRPCPAASCRGLSHTTGSDEGFDSVSDQTHA